MKTKQLKTKAKEEPWESSKCPSGQLEEIFILAESFRAIEHAPSVRLDHFLLAVIVIQFPPTAEAILQVFENVKVEWHKTLQNGEKMPE